MTEICTCRKIFHLIVHILKTHKLRLGQAKAMGVARCSPGGFLEGTLAATWNWNEAGTWAQRLWGADSQFMFVWYIKQLPPHLWNGIWQWLKKYPRNFNNPSFPFLPFCLSNDLPHHHCHHHHHCCYHTVVNIDLPLVWIRPHAQRSVQFHFIPATDLLSRNLS